MSWSNDLRITYATWYVKKYTDVCFEKRERDRELKGVSAKPSLSECESESMCEIVPTACTNDSLLSSNQFLLLLT